MLLTFQISYDAGVRIVKKSKGRLGIKDYANPDLMLNSPFDSLPYMLHKAKWKEMNQKPLEAHFVHPIHLELIKDGLTPCTPVSVRGRMTIGDVAINKNSM